MDMLLSKGDIMKALGMTRNVDSALPHPFVVEITKKTDIRYDEVCSNFVMDYTVNSWGQFTPITKEGIYILKVINALMEMEIPYPEKVFNLVTGLIETVETV